MRLNKYISHHSKLSRRDADKKIEAGEVKVDGKIVTNFGFDVLEGMKVQVGQSKVRPTEEYTVICYNKQKGELVTKKDDRGRKTIYHTLPSKFGHFIPVGRLDYASEGLLLLTDSPKIVEFLMTAGGERVYQVKIKGHVTRAMEVAMQEGLVLKDATKGAHEKSEITEMEFAPFAWYKIVKDAPTFSKLKVAINEGKNRELRRFFAHFGADVSDLKRIAYGEITLSMLPNGKTRYFTKKQYEELREQMEAVEKQNTKEK